MEKIGIHGATPLRNWGQTRRDLRPGCWYSLGGASGAASRFAPSLPTGRRERGRSATVLRRIGDWPKVCASIATTRCVHTDQNRPQLEIAA